MKHSAGIAVLGALVFAMGACGSDDEASSPHSHGTGGTLEGGLSDSSTDSANGGTGGGATDGSVDHSAAGSSTGGSSTGGSPTGGSAGTNLHDCNTQGPADCSAPPTDAPYCADNDPCYLTLIQSAIAAALANHPELFVTESPDAAPGCTLVVDVPGYVAAVGETVEAAGLCFDPGAPSYEEVGVKHDNGFAETFDILTSEMCVRSGSGIYRGWCSPPWF